MTCPPPHGGGGGREADGGGLDARHPLRRCAPPPPHAEEDRKHGLPPIAHVSARVLVLGSLPGDASLAAAQYYAHPQNSFWRLMGEVVGAPLAGIAYADRLGALEAAGVALWDTIASARRPGSLDSAIADGTPADLAALVRRLPGLRAVGFNGQLAARHGTAALAHSGLALVALPSSSPAHTMAFADKRAAWMALRAFLDVPGAG